MRILTLGAGMQGKAALLDLAAQPDVSELVAADLDLEGLLKFVQRNGLEERVRCLKADAGDPSSLSEAFRFKPEIVLDLLPVPLHPPVNELAVANGAHLVNSSYTDDSLRRLGARAETRGLALLPECGMDPGLDLILLGEAVRRVDRVESVLTYGAGFPEPSAATNPLRYKVTWNLEGVLKSYQRQARIVRDGRAEIIPERELFRPEHLHRLTLPELGELEAFPNGDVVHYLEQLSLEPERLTRAGRYVLRLPGHNDLVRALIELHLLDDEPAVVDGQPVARKRFLAACLGPHLRYGPAERDVVVVRVDIAGRLGAEPRRVLLQLIDRRDLATGLTAMSRTVGFTASIGALLIGRGVVTARGLLSPLRDLPYAAMVEELTRRGIRVEEQVC